MKAAAAIEMVVVVLISLRGAMYGQRVATPANADLLLDYAKLMPAAQLEKLTRKYAYVQRHGQEPHPLSDLHRRYVQRRDTEDGMVKIVATLHPEEAELVWTMLNHATAQLAHGTAEPVSDASAESQAGTQSSGSRRCGHVARGRGRRLWQLCCGAGAGGIASGGAVGDGGIASGDAVCGSRRCGHVACGRGRRSWQPCYWADGGDTSLENTGLVCTAHHRHVDEYGYTVELGPDQRPRFRDPDGRIVMVVPAPPETGELGWSRICAANAPLTIDADTIACEWDGRPVDYGAIIGHLVDADGLQ